MEGKEVLPNPTDGWQSLRYLQDQAAQGHFEGHTSAYLVMLYLVMNMWTKVPNKENARLGMVMYGRSGIETIASSTTVSERSVQRALGWLAEEGWIETDRAFTTAGREDRRYLLVLLDHRAHHARETLRKAGAALENIVREGDTMSPPRVTP